MRFWYLGVVVGVVFGYRERGWVHVVQPNIGLTGGGSRSMHQLHDLLLELGFRSKMHLVNPLLSSSVHNATFEEIVKAVEKMGPEDVVVAPELAEISDDFVNAATRNGGMVVRWMLGLPRGFDSLDARIVQIASTYYIRRQILGCVGPVLTSPLEPEIYQEAEKMTTSEERTLFLVDDDTLVDLDELQLSLPEYEVVRFKNVTRSERYDTYRKAVAFLDGHLPGRERANFEASLFGATPIIEPSMHGASFQDYPEDVPRLPLDFDKIGKKVDSLRAAAVGWRTQFPRRVGQIFDTRQLTVLVKAADSDNTFWFFPLFVSILCFAPLADVVYDDDLDRSRLGPGAYDALNRLGLLSRIRRERTQRPFMLEVGLTSLFVDDFDVEKNGKGSVVDRLSNAQARKKLEDHPLWQSLFPLFHDQVRLELAPSTRGSFCND